MLLSNNGERFIFDECANIFLEVPTFVFSLSMGSLNDNFHLSKSKSLFLILSLCLLSQMKTSAQDFVFHKLLFSINKEDFRFLTIFHFGVKLGFQEFPFFYFRIVSLSLCYPRFLVSRFTTLYGRGVLSSLIVALLSDLINDFLIPIIRRKTK